MVKCLGKQFFHYLNAIMNFTYIFKMAREAEKFEILQK